MKIVQLYAGLDPQLNRLEGQQTRLFNRLVDTFTSDLSISDRSDVRHIVRTLEDKRFTLSPSRKKLLEIGIQTVYDKGTQHADLLLRRRHRVVAAAIEDHPYVKRLTRYAVEELEGIGEDLREKLIDSLWEGYQAGEGIRSLRNRVDAITASGRVSASRTARTTTSEVFNQSNIVRYAEAEVDGIQYLAAGEEACDICGALDKTIWAIGDPDLVHPPTHHNCRCTTIPWLGKLPGPRRIDSAVMDYYSDFRSKYMDLPLMATA